METNLYSINKESVTNKKRSPNYGNIYKDLFRMRYPQYYKEFKSLLDKEELNYFDIQRTHNRLLKENVHLKKENQKYKAYDKETILKMLHYGKINNLNNTELAKHFNLSRNTVTKWKKMFITW